MESLKNSFLNQPVSRLPLIGPSYVQKLSKLNIYSFYDLLHHYPFRYADLSKTSTIASIKEGDIVTLQGTILEIKTVYLRTGKTLQKALFSDGFDVISISWFNQPYLVTTFSKNPQVSLSGKVKIFHSKASLTSPQFELIRNTSVSPTTKLPDSQTKGIHTGRLVPVYPETSGLSSKWLRSRVHTLLNLLPREPEWLTPDIVTKHQLISEDQALRQIHFPETIETAQLARERLSFDELLVWQLQAQTRKRLRHTLPNHYRLLKTGKDLLPFTDSLPFKLTTGQNQAIIDILKDLQSDTPMNRLLEGDVGSGKTVVAAAAMFLLARTGYTSVLMAPTEILAHQHAQTLKKILSPLKLEVKVATRSVHDNLTDADVVIGTQAVLFRQLPENLGLVVIDEQHRFGVKQRSQLLQHPKPPHLLSMTATPIPRTVTLTLYADLEVSILDELPIGRIPVKTWVVPSSKRPGAYQWIKTKVKEGGQVFIVCPLIETSEAEALSEVKAAETEFYRLQQDIFPGLKLGLVHGKLKPKEKDRVIQQFIQKEFPILVATPVIEVGIDIPNATIMVIEGAERFGLAQLHQLRGRVGRGDQQSYCLLFPSSDKSQAITRLKYVEANHSGFQLAELDLKLRGPGDVFGNMQSGFIDFKIASLQDETMIKKTFQTATDLIQKDASLNSFPQIKERFDLYRQSLSEPN